MGRETNRKMFQLTHIITGDTCSQRVRGTVGDDKNTLREVRIMRKGERRKFSIPGTNVVKQASETRAQKSSHQNMRFCTRRAIRTTVIRPEIRKKTKEQSMLCEGQ